AGGDGVGYGVARRAGQVREVGGGEGGRPLRRKGRPPRPACGRGTAQGALPECDGRRCSQLPGVALRNPMDVLVLIDKLDGLVHNAKAVPLTDQVRIDREEIYDILDQMRATIPEEIKQARWIVKERQEMLAEAKREQD